MKTVDQSEGNYHVTPMTTRGKKSKLMKTGKTQVEGVELVGKVSDLKHEKAQVQKYLIS